MSLVHYMDGWVEKTIVVAYKDDWIDDIGGEHYLQLLQIVRQKENGQEIEMNRGILGRRNYIKRWENPWFWKYLTK